MPQPHIEVLGVYRLAISQELLQEQLDILYGYEMSDRERRRAKQECKEQLESVALIEVLIKDRDSRFQVGDFTQPQEGVPRDRWQAPWAEAFLTPDGESLLVEQGGESPDDHHFRCAFFLLCYETDKPLRTSYGELNCPPVEEMPERLRRLVSFNPVD
jgi:hypothetical protein